MESTAWDRQGSHGFEWTETSRRGGAWRGSRVPDSLGSARERKGWDRNGSSESEWKGMAFHGVAWIGSRGPEGLGVDGTREDGRVMAGIGEAVMDRKGTACIGIDWTGKAATDGLGVASRVMALNGSSGTGSNG